MSAPVEMFFSYAHEDEALMDDLRRQLDLFVRQGVIRKWHDRLIPPGTEWRGQIDAHLRQSDIILLLVSPHFFESDYCDAEMGEAMRRHEAGEAKVIPIILRPYSWETAPFARLQALPTGGRPISLWPNRDEACLNVADGIMRVVREIRGGTIASPTRAEIAVDSERSLAVRVHRAYFVGEPTECYFVNLTNLSSSRALEITHLWYEDETHHIPILQSARPLPVRLDLDQSCETWIEVGSLPSRHRNDAFGHFRARISTGKVFISEKNMDVPPVGNVPGGPVC